MKNNLNKKKIYLLAAIILLLIFLHSIKIIKPVETYIISGINKGGEILYGIGQSWSSFFSSSEEKVDLQNNNNDLQKQVNDLLAEKAYWQTIEKENERLKNYLQFFEDNDYEKVMTRLVSSDNLFSHNNSKTNIYLNKGESDGVEKGMAIINEEGILVGKILSVKENSAQACLSINEDCKFAAGFNNKDETLGVVKGNLGLTISMNLIPQDQNIKSGDLVVSSGLQNNIPSGLIIGRVSSVIKESNDIWQEATIEPLYDLKELNVLAVIIP